MTEILWWKNLASIDDIRNSAWLTHNSDITDDFVRLYLDKAGGDMWTYVWWRYNLKSFTDVRFLQSMAYSFLKWTQIILASSYLLNEGYWSQRLEEDNGAKTKYEQQMAMLDDVRKGNTRLLDVDLEEFDLVPMSPNKTPPKNVWSSFNETVDKTFKVSDLR